MGGRVAVFATATYTERALCYGLLGRNWTLLVFTWPLLIPYQRLFVNNNYMFLTFKNTQKEKLTPLQYCKSQVVDNQIKDKNKR